MTSSFVGFLAPLASVSPGAGGPERLTGRLAHNCVDDATQFYKYMRSKAYNYKHILYKSCSRKATLSCDILAIIVLKGKEFLFLIVAAVCGIVKKAFENDI